MKQDGGCGDKKNMISVDRLYKTKLIKNRPHPDLFGQEAANPRADELCCRDGYIDDGERDREVPLVDRIDNIRIGGGYPHNGEEIQECAGG